MLAMIIANLPAVMSVGSAILGVVVMIMHLAHKDDVAAQIQGIQDALDKLAPQKK